MAIHDLYSKRLKRKRGETPEIYTYDSIPQELIVQLFHIFDDGIGHVIYTGRSDILKVWKNIVSTLNREYGSFTLARFSHGKYSTHYDEFYHFMFSEHNVDRLIDGIELALGAMNTTAREAHYGGRYDNDNKIDELIEEANQRLKEHGVGYRFAENLIVRIDSEFIHAEVTKPALSLLQGEWCSGAEEEFYRAHEHYRHGNFKETLNECLKSFESILKSVCRKRGWEISDRATASSLIQTCLDNGLIPSFWQSHFSSLKSLLESGIPTGRNKMSGHGQGATPTEVPRHIVSYMLNMTAACLLFICEAETELEQL